MFSPGALAWALALVFPPVAYLPAVSVIAPESSAAASSSCQIVDAQVSWGFKESFRSYISGAIAQGEWLVGGDVGYETPNFLFSDGVGEIAPDASTGQVTFVGTMEFVGHGGILDTTLTNPTLVFLSPREATLVVDVNGDTMEELRVRADRVQFASVTWKSGDSRLDTDTGRWSVSQARVVLTQEGSAAFGTYLAGEELDPLSFELQANPGCVVGPSWSVWWISAGVTGLVVAGIAVVVILSRGNRWPGPKRP